MNNPLRTIRLYGKLGAKFGRVFRLAVNSPAEAVRALSMQLAGFERYLMNSRDHGIGYAVFAGTENLGVEQLQYPTGDADIRIAPIVIGSKNGGIFQIILGVILIVVGVVFSAYLGPLAAPIIGAGISMVLGGVIQLLSPHPKGLGAKDAVQNIPNYSFNGPVNTEAQGNPVPLLYGELIVGSSVISASIQTNEDLYVPTSSNILPVGGTGLGPGGGGAGGGSYLVP